jgi:hypothetical protein
MGSPEDDVNGRRGSTPEPERSLDQVAKTEKPTDSITKETSLRGLEMRYMELLEKRIADLEAKLKEAEKVRL